MPPYELCGSDTAIRYPDAFYSTFDRITENKQAVAKVRSVQDDFNKVTLKSVPSMVIDFPDTVEGHYYTKDKDTVNETKSDCGFTKPAALRRAEKKLTDLAFKKGYLTKRDVEESLGIKRKPIYGETIIWKLQETKDTLEHVNPGTIDKVKFAIETVYDSAYTPDKRPFGLAPERMWTNGAYTTVEWSDGTKTTAKAENPETMTQYGGFCACLAKKLYGSTSNSIRHMQRAIDIVNWPAKKKEIERERLKELRDKRIERKKKEFENKVQIEMELLKAKREAERRLAQQGGDK